MANELSKVAILRVGWSGGERVQSEINSGDAIWSRV